ncbi:hypothetical protein T265_00245 [Opisthorchis viverrini]|uniref:Tubulin/FtsZ 2-layer sandwich domain-containing protein n=1 Tax=Opisthorchis viverrini TaxID=6198 RepID=A0A075A6R9_OPIVI|nr:hypothetical protein T265_00245 [Opisthorchis viverrini]KER34067.1 hypothetical protein T265_00245 [Opisthorchis viverrini]
MYELATKYEGLTSKPRLQQRLRFVQWNREGWKVGHCLVPPVGLPCSLLTLSNNTSIRERFLEILERFYKLYKRKPPKTFQAKLVGDFSKKTLCIDRNSHIFEDVDNTTARWMDLTNQRTVSTEVHIIRPVQPCRVRPCLNAQTRDPMPPSSQLGAKKTDKMMAQSTNFPGFL